MGIYQDGGLGEVVIKGHEISFSGSIHKKLFTFASRCCIIDTSKHKRGFPLANHILSPGGPDNVEWKGFDSPPSEKGKVKCIWRTAAGLSDGSIGFNSHHPKGNPLLCFTAGGENGICSGLKTRRSETIMWVRLPPRGPVTLDNLFSVKW